MESSSTQRLFMLVVVLPQCDSFLLHGVEVLNMFVGLLQEGSKD